MVGEVKSVIWGVARTKGEGHKRELTKNMFLHIFFDITDFFPDTTAFYDRKLASQTNDIKDRDLLTNKIVVYTRLTSVNLTKISLNDFE